jgi:hypothetical protein
MDLLMRPLLNKETAFSDDERARFSLHGLLPPELQTFEQQVVRAYGGFTRGINHELEAAYLFACSAGYQQVALLQTFPRPHRENDADCLHTDRRRGV